MGLGEDGGGPVTLTDLPLHASPSPSGRPPAKSPTRWIIVGAAVIVAGSLLALRWMIRSVPETATPTPTRATDAGAIVRRPKPQAIDLPPLDQSDDIVTGMFRLLSQNPLVTRLLATPRLVRQIALVVQQIGDGRTPADLLPTLRPASRLNMLGDHLGPVDPKSYARWNAATSALTSIDPNNAAQIYVNTKALFDAAYRDLGHPNGDFDESIVRAIQTLAATPAVAGNPELIRHPDRPGYFEHSDPKLGSALPVQKQFLLIGPENRQQVMAWLKSLAAALELKID
jgi:hypothetical protein